MCILVDARSFMGTCQGTRWKRYSTVFCREWAFHLHVSCASGAEASGGARLILIVPILRGQKRPGGPAIVAAGTAAVRNVLWPAGAARRGLPADPGSAP